MGISQSIISRRGSIASPPAVCCRWRVSGDGGDGGRGNESWLLADAWKEQEEVESQSVHSSFQFSFGSQAEAEVGRSPAAETTTVLLLVNTEDKGEEAAGSMERLGVRRKQNTGAAAGDQQWRRWRLDSLEQSISPVAGGLVRFSYDEIRLATRGFSKRRELGRGALSRVYKGKIGGGILRPAVAIKRVDGPERESAKAFCRELLIASSLSSPFIVPLLGYCIDDSEGLFLVYKYVSGGSLDLLLHENEKRRKVLRWKLRYKVAVGVAKAVEYLHFGSEKCVVHRDIKPANILLSPKKNPMLCDFGLATWTHGCSLPFLCKEVKGTFGYLAPEYFQHGKLSDKTDVYAFGIVLLELITGRKALDENRPQGNENLVLWAKPHLLQGESGIEKLVDPRLRPGSYCWSEMRRMVRAARGCLSSTDSTRPSIDRILAILLDKEGNAGSECSMFSSNGRLADFHEPQDELDIRSYLPIAMLGVSENGKDDSGYSERVMKLL